MAATINVRLINAQSDDPVTNLTVPDGTTLGQFLELNRVNTDSMSVQVRLDGETVDWDMEDELEDGVRVTVTPEKIKGA
jgi:hypothetical protein